MRMRRVRAKDDIKAQGKTTTISTSAKVDSREDRVPGSEPMVEVSVLKADRGVDVTVAVQEVD